MYVNSGWANNCGKELFTLGWIPCDIVEPPDTPDVTFNIDIDTGKIKRKRLREEEEALAFVASFMRMLDEP